MPIYDSFSAVSPDNFDSWPDSWPDSWDDDPWDAFLADDDQRDPLPERGDFWPDDDSEQPSLDVADDAAAFAARPHKGGSPC